MEIKTSREIWKDITIIEPTEDHWGRGGRGIPFRYINPDCKNKQWISVDDILKELDLSCCESDEHAVSIMINFIKKISKKNDI